jgi:hypothetical protein
MRIRVAKDETGDFSRQIALPLGGRSHQKPFYAMRYTRYFTSSPQTKPRTINVQVSNN